MSKVLKRHLGAGSSGAGCLPLPGTVDAGRSQCLWSASEKRRLQPNSCHRGKAAILAEAYLQEEHGVNLLADTSRSHQKHKDPHVIKPEPEHVPLAGMLDCDNLASQPGHTWREAGMTS
uniref:Uncharacterized protein n=1 Tax=Sphaerodactylus townsendi TaxID=933632 RepID=A0ACB8EHM7_9SAUR